MTSIPSRVEPGDLEPRYITERERPIRSAKRLFDALGLDFRLPPDHDVERPTAITVEPLRRPARSRKQQTLNSTARPGKGSGQHAVTGIGFLPTPDSCQMLD
jgi:hypothetical protein